MNEVNGLGLFDFCFDFHRNESFFLLLFFTFSILQSCSLYLNSTQLISFHCLSFLQQTIQINNNNNNNNVSSFGFCKKCSVCR